MKTWPQIKCAPPDTRTARADARAPTHTALPKPSKKRPRVKKTPAARAGVSEIIRQGGREFAAAAQSGRDFLTTLFLIRCPFVKRVTKTVRWHPRAQHSVRIAIAMHC